MECQPKGLRPELRKKLLISISLNEERNNIKIA
jgi:hypothetical protein